MTHTDDIAAKIVERIRQRMAPDRIVLFGSRARGDARETSDFDILIVMQSTEPRFKRAVPIYAAVADLSVELDAIVYTPEEIDDWRQVSASLVATALREGVVLYEKSA